MLNFRIIQRLETCEEVHAPCPDFPTMQEAVDWIRDNASQYEESIFWIEPITKVAEYDPHC